jgi:hypothetical protein
VTKKHQGTRKEEVQAKSQRPKKSERPILDTRVSGFSRIDRVQVGFEIYFV